MKIEVKSSPVCPNFEQYRPSPDQNPELSAGRGAGGRAKLGSRSAFTLIETIVATFVAAIVLPSIYAGLAAGFAMIQVTREDLRATQVILQRMEAIRLSSFQTIQNPAAYPTNQTAYYSESGKTNGHGGAAYTVTYNWAPGPASLPPSYRTNVVLVTVGATWKSGNVQRSRSMQTYVARYGIRRYVCGN